MIDFVQKMISVDSAVNILFGNGTLRFHTVSNDEQQMVAILIRQGEQIQLGTKDQDEKEYDKTDYPVWLVFKNKEGLDLLIKSLNGIRQYFEDQETSIEARQIGIEQEV